MENNFLKYFRPAPFFVTGFGFALCLFGILGFTESSQNLLFGFFKLTFFHSLLFVFLGIVVLLARRKNTRRSVVVSLISVGLIFFILCIVGVLKLRNKDSVYLAFHLFSLNSYDNILHFFLGIFSLGFGYLLRK